MQNYCHISENTYTTLDNPSKSDKLKKTVNCWKGILSRQTNKLRPNYYREEDKEKDKIHPFFQFFIKWNYLVLFLDSLNPLSFVRSCSKFQLNSFRCNCFSWSTLIYVADLTEKLFAPEFVGFLPHAAERCHPSFRLTWIKEIY